MYCRGENAQRRSEQVETPLCSAPRPARTWTSSEMVGSVSNTHPSSFPWPKPIPGHLSLQGFTHSVLMHIWGALSCQRVDAPHCYRIEPTFFTPPTFLQHHLQLLWDNHVPAAVHCFLLRASSSCPCFTSALVNWWEGGGTSIPTCVAYIMTENNPQMQSHCRYKL